MPDKAASPADVRGVTAPGRILDEVLEYPATVTNTPKILLDKIHVNNCLSRAKRVARHNVGRTEQAWLLSIAINTGSTGIRRCAV